jgi:hypothetical protein
VLFSLRLPSKKTEGRIYGDKCAVGASKTDVYVSDAFLILLGTGLTPEKFLV